MRRAGISLFGCDGGRSGIGRYATELLRRLPGLTQDMAFEALVHPSEAPGLVPDEALLGTDLVSDHLRSPLVNILWNQLALPARCRRRGYDVLFVPAGNRRLPAPPGCPVVATLHDLNARHLPGKYGALRDVYNLSVLPRLARRLDHILTVSEWSKRDIVELCQVPSECVTVIPLAADRAVFHPRDPAEARDRARAALGFEEPFLLYVSRIENPGKNHLRLIEAFEILKQRTRLPHRLVLAGPDWNGAEEVHAAAARSPCGDSIHFTGYLPGGVLPWLYVATDLSVVPSLFEGFGLPVLEAMSSGAPVACSRRGSLPEVGGEAASYFDPEDPEEMAERFAELLMNPLRSRAASAAGLARAQRFTWEATATRTLEILQAAAQGEFASASAA